MNVVVLEAVHRGHPRRNGTHLPHVADVPRRIGDLDGAVDGYGAVGFFGREVPRVEGKGFDFVDGFVGGEVVAAEGDGGGGGGGGEGEEGFGAAHAIADEVEAPGDPAGGGGRRGGEGDGEGAVGGVEGEVEGGAEGGEVGAVGVGAVELLGSTSEGRMGRGGK